MQKKQSSPFTDLPFSPQNMHQYLSNFLINLEEDKHLDPTKWAENWQKISEKALEIQQLLMSKQNPQPNPLLDPFQIGQNFMHMMQSYMHSPTEAAELQIQYWQNMTQLWQQTTEKMLASSQDEVTEKTKTKDIITPTRDDRRFKDTEWDENAIFSYLKQSYLLTADWMRQSVHQNEALSEEQKQKLGFVTRQFTDAMSPTNFWITNPTVLKETIHSHGENLLNGLDNMLKDFDETSGQIKISMTDPDAFEIGKNLANTSGKVIYENDLMQLIQYTPTTEKTYKRPLLIVPPWINKFYILDLGDKKSFIKYALSQGHSVFIISWVNPTQNLRYKNFENYMLEGPLAAIDAISETTGEKSINAIGYCIGGTLLSATLAYMAANNDKRINSATFFTTLVDFEDAGELKIFIDEEQITAIEDMMRQNGFLDGSQMATTFNMLRPNDLIWSFVINNYLMGKTPFPFDLLYWNSDSTRMPEAMHSFYLRNMYQKNLLCQSKALKLNDIAIDLNKINIPCFILSTKEDHIAPWEATYKATNYYKGKTEFVLAGSGHIAGVINPPPRPNTNDKEKYGYWTNQDTSLSTEDWLNSADYHTGSWWPYWSKWIAAKSGKKVNAYHPESGKLKPIEEAPGRYVKQR